MRGFVAPVVQDDAGGVLHAVLEAVPTPPQRQSRLQSSGVAALSDSESNDFSTAWATLSSSSVGSDVADSPAFTPPPSPLDQEFDNLFGTPSPLDSFPRLKSLPNPIAFARLAGAFTVFKRPALGPVDGPLPKTIRTNGEFDSASSGDSATRVSHTITSADDPQIMGTRADVISARLRTISAELKATRRNAAANALHH